MISIFEEGFSQNIVFALMDPKHVQQFKREGMNWRLEL